MTTKDYRPISLCNVCYKVIFKILVNRLKCVLPSILSQEQSTFITGRVIADNVLLTQKIFPSLGNRHEGKKLMAIKLDVERAYDRMRWGFLKKVMDQFGFAGKFIDLIMGYICDPSFTVLLNGTSTTWFKSTTGLWQGDPLSPFLFILGAKVLTRLLKREQVLEKITCFPLGDGHDHLGHLLFADDCILVAQASTVEARAMNEVLQRYCSMSDQ